MFVAFHRMGHRLGTEMGWDTCPGVMTTTHFFFLQGCFLVPLLEAHRRLHPQLGSSCSEAPPCTGPGEQDSQTGPNKSGVTGARRGSGHGKNPSPRGTCPVPQLHRILRKT